MDFENGSYCNGTYEGNSHTRMAVDRGCDAKECRFHSCADGEIAAEEEII